MEFDMSRGFSLSEEMRWDELPAYAPQWYQLDLRK